MIPGEMFMVCLGNITKTITSIIVLIVPKICMLKRSMIINWINDALVHSHIEGVALVVIDVNIN